MSDHGGDGRCLSGILQRDGYSVWADESDFGDGSEGWADKRRGTTDAGRKLMNSAKRRSWVMVITLACAGMGCFSLGILTSGKAAAVWVIWGVPLVLVAFVRGLWMALEDGV